MKDQTEPAKTLFPWCPVNNGPDPELPEGFPFAPVQPLLDVSLRVFQEMLNERNVKSDYFIIIKET